MDEVEKFTSERKSAVIEMSQDTDLKKKSLDWMLAADRYKYSYNYSWLGRPIIKYPNDIVATQEIIWKVKPDLIIETGIAHGGSLMLSASMLELIGGNGKVLGIDIDIREHNKKEIENHPMYKRIEMIQGSSIDPKVTSKVEEISKEYGSVMVFLDSLHTHQHALQELKFYSTLVTVGSYLVLPDTFIEYFPKGYFKATRPWDVGNNPMTALREFLDENENFVVDRELNDKLMITEAFDGYLIRTK